MNRRVSNYGYITGFGEPILVRDIYSRGGIEGDISVELMRATHQLVYTKGKRFTLPRKYLVEYWD